MSDLTIRAFIQARMSSTRFPGKVLAPLNGQPVIKRVISRVATVIPLQNITVATSSEQSDDPLACYVKQIGVSVLRGPLDNAFERFRICANEFPCDWFFRICADSPMLDDELLKVALGYANRPKTDLVTNVQIRSFPKGHSVEMIRSESFMKIDPLRLSVEETEHLTKFYYNHPDEFNIVNIDSGNPSLAHLSLTVDTLEDLVRLEQRLSARSEAVQAEAFRFL